MKIKDLLNVEKAIEAKNIELAEKKQELEKLRQEAKELELMIEINNTKNQNDMIDISNIFLFRVYKSSVVRFIKTTESFFDGYRIIDIFSNEYIHHCSKSNFIDAKFGRYYAFSVSHIKEVYPEVLAYQNSKVPKLLLQKLYYEANSIDEKVLKRALMKD